MERMARGVEVSSACPSGRRGLGAVQGNSRNKTRGLEAALHASVRTSARADVEKNAIVRREKVSWLYCSKVQDTVSCLFFPASNLHELATSSAGPRKAQL